MGQHTYPFHPARSGDDQQIVSEPYSPRPHLSHSPVASLDPAQILRNGHDVMLPNTSAPDYPYAHPARQQHSQSQDLTPCSAVSSFNLPAQYDNSLITPVSITGSPCLPTRADSFASGDKDIKQEQLSPTTFSPYQLFNDDDDFGSRYNQPMKSKRTSGGLQLPTTDSGFPSTFVHPDPYYGQYGVSATTSNRTLDTPPSLNYSPSLNSAGGLSTGSYHSHHQTPPLSATSSHSFRSIDPTPILTEPNPSDLRAAVKYRKKSRQISAPSRSSNSTISGGVSKAESPGRLDSLSPPRGRKRKTKAESIALEELHLPDDLPREDRLLLELRMKGLEWKEIAKQYAEALKQPQLATACLQMRKKRLVDRLIANAENSSPSSWGSTSKASFHEHVPRYSDAPRQTSSPRNWAESRPSLSTYHTSPAFPTDLERLTPLERAPKATWPELGSPLRMHSGHSTISTDEIRARPLLSSSTNYYGQRQEHNQNYGYENQQGNRPESQEQLDQRRIW